MGAELRVASIDWTKGMRANGIAAWLGRGTAVAGRRAPLLRYGKFCVVGGSGVVVDMRGVGFVGWGFGMESERGEGAGSGGGDGEQLRLERSVDV